nr:hypothetical protein GCM10020092_077180 [Actinoplanes digitatis]
MPPIGGTEVAALVAFGPDDVWTLGYQLLPNNRKADHVEHWDGKRFTAEDTGLPTLPPPGGNQGELGSATPIFAAAGVPETGELWAVGWSDPLGRRTPHDPSGLIAGPVFPRRVRGVSALGATVRRWTEEDAGQASPRARESCSRRSPPPRPRRPPPGPS